jgi:hypothetical protein
MFPEQDVGAAKNGDIASVENVMKALPTSPKNPKVAAVQDGSLPRVRVSLLVVTSCFISYASYLMWYGRWDNSVCIATEPWAGQLRNQSLLTGGASNFCPLHSVQTGSAAHPTSSPIGTGAFFPMGKMTGACS